MYPYARSTRTLYRRRESMVCVRMHAAQESRTSYDRSGVTNLCNEEERSKALDRMATKDSQFLL